MSLPKQMVTLVMLVSIPSCSLSRDFTDVRKRFDSVTSASMHLSGLTVPNISMPGPAKAITTYQHDVLSTGGQMSVKFKSGSGLPQSISESELVTRRGDNIRITFESNIPTTDGTTSPRSVQLSPSTTTSRTIGPQSRNESPSTTTTRTIGPRSTNESPSTTTSRTIGPQSRNESPSTTTSRTIGPRSRNESPSTTTSRTIGPQSRNESPSTTTSSPIGPQSRNESLLPDVTVTGKNVSNQTIPCPRLCICNQISAWEKFVRANMRLINRTITDKYSWQEIGEMIVRQKRIRNLSVIETWKRDLFKEVACHVGEDQQLSVDLDFRNQAMGTDAGHFNISFICSNGGVIVVSKLDAFLESGFVFLVNCSVRTAGYLESSRSLVKLASVTVDNSTLQWLSNVTISNTKWLTLMCIYNTPLTGYPRIIDRTNGQLKSVYFKYNNMMDTNCSFSVGSEMTLTTIEITNNNLRELPACLLTSALTSLTLSNNRLENISALLHPRLVPATNLSDLWLDHNFITNIGMFSYMKLTILDLSHNKIQHLNKLTFNRLPELTYLDLSWNRLTIIPAGTFKAFFFLQFLNVSHNLIREFSYLQSTLSPADINIHHNQLMYPPFYREGYNIVTAHTIKAEDNPYQCDCKAELFKKRIGLLYSKSNTKYKIQFKHLDKYLCFSPKSLHNQTLLSLNFSDVCPVVTDCPASCECSFNKTTNVTEVRCSSLNMTSLPATVPEGKVVLLFSGNGIHNVSTRGYFTRAEKLNLSRNDLEQLNSPVCELWKHLQIVDISVNKIRYLPKCFETFNLSAMALHVYDNPWACDCTSLWMLSWFKRNKQHIPEYERMACGNSEFLGIPLNSFVASELDCDPSSYLHIAIPLGFLALFAIVLIPLAYKFRFQTQVFIHAQFHARPFDRRKLENAEYDYEVFLSYHSQNEAWVVHTLMPRLETGDRPYRACVHYRDFEVGAAVADNIVNAVQKSQCTVVILSKDYIASEWCVFEFQKAHHEVLKDGARKLVVILMEDIPMEDTFPELKVYLKRNTYLRLDDRWFWQKLFFCLPDPLNDNVNRNQRQVGKGFDNHHMHEMDDLQ